MDPISKALERARQEQHSVRGWVQPSPLAREESPIRPQPLGASPRVVLDPTVLRSNCILSGTDADEPIVVDKYRLLRTRVLQIMRARGWHSLGITSPGIKAGKSVTAINLAISVAREGNHRVLLVDGDIRKPSVERYLGLDVPGGLPDYLTGSATLNELMVNIEHLPNLSVLPGHDQGLSDPSPDLLKSSSMHDLLQGVPAADRSTLVIVDLPPALVGDDVIAVAAHLDALLIVVDEGSTNMDELQQTAELLRNFNVLGTVLNKSTEKVKHQEGYYQHRAATVAKGSTVDA